MAIGKDAYVEAIDCTLDEALRLVKDLLLSRFGAENTIEVVAVVDV